MLAVALLRRGHSHDASPCCPARPALAGIAGFSLGGGWGWRSKGHGLGVDNVLSYRVVLADGSIVDATADGPHAELFWGLRGGGHNNLGVVTALRYRAFPTARVPTANVTFDAGAHPDRAAAALQLWGDKYLDGSEGGQGIPALVIHPQFWGDRGTGSQRLVMYAALYEGDEARLRALMKPFEELGAVESAYESIDAVHVPAMPVSAAGGGGGALAWASCLLLACFWPPLRPPCTQHTTPLSLTRRPHRRTFCSRTCLRPSRPPARPAGKQSCASIARCRWAGSSGRPSSTAGSRGRPIPRATPPSKPGPTRTWRAWRVRRSCLWWTAVVAAAAQLSSGGRDGRCPLLCRVTHIARTPCPAGKVTKAAADDTAFVHRAPGFDLVVHSCVPAALRWRCCCRCIGEAGRCCVAVCPAGLLTCQALLPLSCSYYMNVEGAKEAVHAWQKGLYGDR